MGSERRFCAEGEGPRDKVGGSRLPVGVAALSVFPTPAGTNSKCPPQEGEGQP